MIASAGRKSLTICNFEHVVADWTLAPHEPHEGEAYLEAKQLGVFSLKAFVEVPDPDELGIHVDDANPLTYSTGGDVVGELGALIFRGVLCCMPDKSPGEPFDMVVGSKIAIHALGYAAVNADRETLADRDFDSLMKFVHRPTRETIGQMFDRFMNERVGFEKQVQEAVDDPRAHAIADVALLQSEHERELAVLIAAAGTVVKNRLRDRGKGGDE